MTSEPGQFLNMGLGGPPNLLQGTFPLQHGSTAAPNLPHILKLSNVPSDVTSREAALMFALVSDDLVGVDVKDGAITASFKNPSTCLTTGKLLDGRYIFGSQHAPVKAELETNSSIGAFDKLHISTGISPPHQHQTLQTPQSLQPLAQQFDYQKRSSVGNQRSRFLFSDPFSGATMPTNPGSIDLSDLTGKSLLLMKSQTERDFETPRDPWGQGAVGFASNPQTPGIASVPYEWNQGHSMQAQTSQPPKSPERRTSSFFNGPGNPPNLPASQPASSQPALEEKPTAASVISQGPSNLPPLSTSQAPRSNSAAVPSGSTTPTSSARGSTKDVPDLSLLARVPPPANPADQNPPCNTLYVGNLPPDATEAELRSLFAPQKGFRRLSFRTKNQSSSSNSGVLSHNHGPMCFVEFEDVAHATIALAELYGRALPRPAGSNGKGGIRLSFSKNPLGVRGPGNPRRTSNAQPAQNGAVGNYGYLNYHS